MSTKIRPLQQQVLRQLYEVCEFINEGMIIVCVKGAFKYLHSYINILTRLRKYHRKTHEVVQT